MERKTLFFVAGLALIAFIFGLGIWLSIVGESSRGVSGLFVGGLSFTIGPEPSPPNDSSGSSSSGGGGRGSSTPVVKPAIRVNDLVVDKQQLIIKLKQGEVKEEVLSITNPGSIPVTVTIFTERETPLIRLEKSNLTLAPGETKRVTFQAVASEQTAPGLYVIVFKIKLSEEDIREFPVAIEVASKESLLDVKLVIPEQFKQITPGQDLISRIELFNFGQKGRVDVSIEYVIKDEHDIIVTFSDETLAVETQMSYIKSIFIPRDLPPGRYIFYVKTTYGGNVASSSQWFSIVEKESIRPLWIIIIGIVVASSCITYLIVRWVLRKRVRKKS
jgi:hypothetical protein